MSTGLAIHAMHRFPDSLILDSLTSNQCSWGSTSPCKWSRQLRSRKVAQAASVLTSNAAGIFVVLIFRPSHKFLSSYCGSVFSAWVPSNSPFNGPFHGPFTGQRPLVTTLQMHLTAQSVEYRQESSRARSSCVCNVVTAL